jgi:ferredoxin-nitrate reductase
MSRPQGSSQAVPLQIGQEQEQFGQAMCPYCGVGCLMDVKTRGNKIIEVRGTPDSPVNKGLLCPKGALLGPVLDLPGRLLHPMGRTHREESLSRLTWEAAFTEASQRLQDIREKYGPDSIAMYGSGQLDTESWYLANKLFKGHLGSNHVDSNSRLCMASAVAAYTTMLGSDGPPTCYDDIRHSDCVLIVGSNMADTHPVVFQQLKKHHSQQPETKIIVVDPRLTNTAKQADIFVPLKPGSDIAFFNAVGRLLLERGGADTDFIAQHTAGFEAYSENLASLDLAELVEICGIPLEQLEEVAQTILNAKAFLSFYCMGLGQSSVGTAKHQALIDLHLLTGQIGKLGAGPFSLTGQPNAMGGRELGGLAHLLPGYRQIENAEHRQEVEQYWGVPEGSIHPQKGLTIVEMFQALDEGRIKAIWIAATNPLVSLPNLNFARQALAKAELIIVQDCFETETSQVADFVFPVAQWVERDCTMTNSERRVTRNAKLAEPPGDAKPDWWVFSQFAQHMGYTGFSYEGIEPIWDEFRLLTVSRPCDLSGMTNARLAESPLQWPCPSESHPGTERRYLDKQFATPDGKARFIYGEHKPPQETPSELYPLVLTTGRLPSQWHTMTRTGKIPKLAKQAEHPFIEIHPQDADQHTIGEGDVVIVESIRGRVSVQAKLSDRIKPGLVFMPFHWGDLFSPGNAANHLTSEVFDPVSKEPEYKACAVAIHKGI